MDLQPKNFPEEIVIQLETHSLKQFLRKKKHTDRFPKSLAKMLYFHRRQQLL